MTRLARKTPTLVLALSAMGAACSAQAAPEPPRLVVLIAIDQMRGDLLDRYEEVYRGGFRRFLDEGYRFSVASHAHAHTETAPGHATLSTGVFPSRSGIVANDWSQPDGEAWTSMYSVEDTLSPIVGLPGIEGRSPANLLRTGLADWVLAADPQARVVTLSQKDRSAIMLAGQSRGEVYWINNTRARFVTSGYYRSDYPDWVTRFNETRMPDIVEDSVWLQSAPEGARRLARPDSATYEYDAVHTTFPHVAWEEAGASRAQRNVWALDAQPRADRAVRLLAQEAVTELRLGSRGHTDYLGLSFSSTDYVGHAFGPFSQEQLQNLLQLDEQLGELFSFLDESVGAGGWVAGLSADHGVMTMPEYLVSSGQDTSARRLDPRVVNRSLQAALQEAASRGGSKDEVAERLARRLEAEGLVAKAYTHRDLAVGMPADSFATLYRNAYYPGRAPGALSRFGVEIRFPHNTISSGPVRTSHGSPYWYDRSVPFLLLGAGVVKGQSETPVYTVDLAPTLAGLARIPTPADLDGQRIYR